MLETWRYSDSLPLLIVDADRTVSYVSPALEHHFPGPWNERLGLPLSELPIPGSARASETLDSLWQQNEVEASLVSLDSADHSLVVFPITTLSGDRYSVVLLLNASANENTTVPIQSLIGLLNQRRDRSAVNSRPLTEQDRNLIQSDKMAAVGQLAAGVAHEINNPIGYICSNLNSLSDYTSDLIELANKIDQVESLDELRRMRDKLDYDYIKTDIEDCIVESIEGANRVRDIIAALKDFSHSDDGRFTPTRLEQAITSTLRLVTNELKYKCTLHQDFAEVPPVECNPGQIKQVIMNLLVNAAHAIEEQGTIWLRLGQTNGWVWLEVEDDGRGIDESHRQRIFEPFFTTKHVGKGTGLGLSLSYTIVQRHHGRIEVDSEIGHGSCFRVWLPITQPNRSPAN
ncbi:sensor histidine kinase [Saccharospirillum salsuginis]|uniref:histidine kinase n=1 Tax=Saccharospirillum salsuginis TaxID=418750 RepID=A0A918KAQ2_9GAMM|nr:ATP-binding protein [Saccharospirillum salsuginis]GGX56794.1 hypothetical protein GCM10007392_25320 [Saccharospirillum salsuginis]